jgi:hypothetical protein
MNEGKLMNETGIATAAPNHRNRIIREVPYGDSTLLPRFDAGAATRFT